MNACKGRVQVAFGITMEKMNTLKETDTVCLQVGFWSLYDPDITNSSLGFHLCRTAD